MDDFGKYNQGRSEKRYSWLEQKDLPGLDVGHRAHDRRMCYVSGFNVLAVPQLKLIGGAYALWQSPNLERKASISMRQGTAEMFIIVLRLRTFDSSGK